MKSENLYLLIEFVNCIVFLSSEEVSLIEEWTAPIKTKIQ